MKIAYLYKEEICIKIIIKINRIFHIGWLKIKSLLWFCKQRYEYLLKIEWTNEFILYRSDVNDRQKCKKNKIRAYDKFSNVIEIKELENQTQQKNGNIIDLFYDTIWFWSINSLFNSELSNFKILISK